MRTKADKAAYMREWRKTHAYNLQRETPVWKWGVWRNNMKQRYGVTTEWVGIKFIEQQGKCAICRRDIYYNVWGERKDKTFSLHVDHDHRTGQPRGLLCQDCNIAIGKLQDDVDILQRAMFYVQQYRGLPLICTLAPLGWQCTRKAGHEGPCAAWPDDLRSIPD